MSEKTTSLHSGVIFGSGGFWHPIVTTVLTLNMHRQDSKSAAIIPTREAREHTADPARFCQLDKLVAVAYKVRPDFANMQRKLMHSWLVRNETDLNQRRFDFLRLQNGLLAIRSKQQAGQ